MAKARQVYTADDLSIFKEAKEFSLAPEITSKLDWIEPGAQVNKIEIVKVNWTPLPIDEYKAVNVELPLVEDALNSTSTENALSANQWRVLYDYILNLQSRGRYLSNWNCVTWLPMTNPSVSPYEYRTGDYFIVSNVSDGGTNYRPSGLRYITWQASTTPEEEEVSVDDIYLFDWDRWLLLDNSGKSIAVDQELSTTSRNPVENKVITNAINLKQDTIVAWNNIQIWQDGKTISATDTTYTAGAWISIDANNVISNTQTNAVWWNITGVLSNQTDLQSALNSKQNKLTAWTNISIDSNNVISATDTTYTAWDFDIKDLADTTHLRDTWNGKQDTIVAWNNIQIAADWVTISATDTTYTAWTNVQISNSNVISATDTTYSAWTNVSIDSNNVISAVDTKYQASDFDIKDLSDSTNLKDKWNNKQDTIIAWNNITINADGKTINAIDTTYQASDFDIKDLSDSTNLRDEWSGKQDALIAGTNIQIAADGKTISATDTTYNEVTTADMNAGIDTTPGVVSAKWIADYVKNMVASGVVYKGQVADYDSLPASPSVGDMYNVVAAHSTAPTFDAGTNVVWSWTAWDPMAEMVDLSNLVDLTSAQTISGVKTFSAEPVLSTAKTTPATNDWTKFATEAQVASKQDTLTAGDNITINNNVISALGDMRYADFYQVDAEWSTISLSLNTAVEPEANFTVNAPATIKDGQTYILRVTNWATAYTMTLGQNITNPYEVNTSLTADGVDQFVFFAVDGNLELQPEGGSGNLKVFELWDQWEISASDLQEALDFQLGWWTAILHHREEYYFFASNDDWWCNWEATTVEWWLDYVYLPTIRWQYETYQSNVIEYVNRNSSQVWNYISKDNSDSNTPFIPNKDSQPTSKKYVDDRDDLYFQWLTAWTNVQIAKSYTIVNDQQWPCSTGFHIPNDNETSNLVWLLQNLWLSDTDVETHLHMPHTGYIDKDWVYQNDNNWYFWTTYADCWTAQRFATGNNYWPSSSGWGDLSYWLPIRPFKDSYASPSGAAWTLVTSSDAFEMWYNATDGLISITDGGSLHITLADKNLWATTVYNYGDTLSAANCGNLYQWWNNYGFTWWVDPSSTSSTPVDASGYGPGNYYSSSTYIIGSGRWMDDCAQNLWWWQSQAINKIPSAVISATDTTYTAGTGIDITNGVISNTQTSAAWWNITGTLSNQTDLQNALDAKQDELIAWTNITIASDWRTISATDTTYSQATASTLWLVKLWSNTVQADTVTTPSSTVWRTYPIQVNADGQAVVNVPWYASSWGGGWHEYTSWTGISVDNTNDIISNTWVITVNSQSGNVTVDEFSPSNSWSTGQVLRKTSSGYRWDDEWGAVTSVNNQTWDVYIDEFDPNNSGSVGYVLTKVNSWSWYEWAANDSFWPDNLWTRWQVLTKNANNYSWEDIDLPSGDNNVKFWTLSSGNGMYSTTVTQEIYDWLNADPNNWAIINDTFKREVFVFYRFNNTNDAVFLWVKRNSELHPVTPSSTRAFTSAWQWVLTINHSTYYITVDQNDDQDTVTNYISASWAPYYDPVDNPSGTYEAFLPTKDWQPATKLYVDQAVAWWGWANDLVHSSSITNIWTWTESQYNSLPSHSANTLYFTY